MIMNSDIRQRENELRKILNNKVHGSSEIYNLLIEYFQMNSDNNKYLLNASKKIKKSLAHFPVVISLINDIEKVLKNDNSKALNSYLQSLKIKKEKTYYNIFEKAEHSIRNIKTIITISHSKTLIEVFKLWRNFNPNIKVYVCESRLQNEGILMAEELLKIKIKTQIITEAMAGILMKKVDAVVLGADQILSNGNIVNKTGSRILAITAKYEKVPVYVFSSSDKKVKNRIFKPDISKHRELIINRNKKINYFNEDFEEIEKKLITKIFTN